MSKELVISSNRHETKVAILEDDVLVEIYFQRANEYSLAGSIHKGRVTRVLPGMQSAFVDLGLERDTFLYVSDFFDDNHDDLDKVEDKPARSHGRDRDRDRDRGREREALAAPVQAAETDEFPAMAGEKTAPEGEGDVSAPAIAHATAGAQGEVRSFRDRDRSGRGRDRRGRRGRRRGHEGLPESKYASETASDRATETEEVEGAELAAPHTEPVEPVFLLPGESLAKYRRAQTAAVSAEPAVVQPAPPAEELADGADTDGDDPVETDAEVSALAEEAPAEVVVDPPVVEPPPYVEAVAHPPEEEDEELDVPAEVETGYIDASFAKLPPDIDPAELEEVDAIEEAREELLTESEEDDELEAAQTAAEDLLAAESEEGGMELEDVAEGESGEEGAGEDGPEPARQPQSLTATLRERDRGSRFQRGRRGRRRRGGRGDREERSEAPRGALEAAAPAEDRLAESQAQEPRVADEVKTGENRGERGGRPFRDRGERPPLPSITDLLKAGQEILVQIAKEPIGQKGARITSHIALPGRYCVYMPTVDHNGVSRKIASDEERMRLKKILQTHRQGMTGGFIIRTAGEGQTENDIANDMQFLYNMWLDIRGKAEKRNAPCLVHHDLDIVQRTLRDQVTSDFKTIWLDNEEVYASTVQFVQRFQPALVNRVKLWTRPVPIFDAFNISNELEKALRPKVWLKSGGYIVINQTEALVAIDINTGKFVGKSNRLEDTIVKTNTEAIREIVRQIRLRDLGGIIVVDFIDMDERKNRQKVMLALEEAMRQDRAPYKILQFNDFGLVAITRKRVKQSLERTLCQPCNYCEGAGYVKSVQTVIGEILLESQKLAKAVDDKNVVLRVHPEVAKVLKSHRNQYLEELEGIFNRPVLVTGDPTVHLEKFDLG